VSQDSPIRSIKDLAGKRVAVNVVNSSGWMYMAALLDKNGVDPKQVRFVEVPFPEMNAPLLNRQIDAAAQVDPFTTVALKGGKIRALAYPYVEVQPGADITQYIALRSWIKSKPDLAARFVRAIGKGARFVNDPANEAAARNMNQQFTNLNPALKNDVMLAQLGTRVNAQAIAGTMQLMLKYGLIKKPVDMKDRVYAP